MITLNLFESNIKDMAIRHKIPVGQMYLIEFFWGFKIYENRSLFSIIYLFDISVSFHAELNYSEFSFIQFNCFPIDLDHFGYFYINKFSFNRIFIEKTPEF